MAIGNQLMVYSPQRTAGIGRRTLLPERYGFNPVLPDPTSVNPVGIKPITSVDEALYASTPSQPTGMGVGMSGYEGAAPGKGGMSDAGLRGTALGLTGAVVAGGPLGFALEAAARGLSGGEKGVANYARDAVSWAADKVGGFLGLSGPDASADSYAGPEGGLYGTTGEGLNSDSYAGPEGSMMGTTGLGLAGLGVGGSSGDAGGGWGVGQGGVGAGSGFGGFGGDGWW